MHFPCRSYQASEVGTACRQDRMCQESYGPTEDPATADASTGWGSVTFTRWRHVLHYRDLYQQKLAFVHGYLEAQGRLTEWETRGLAFLKGTSSASEYYDEGAGGRCSAYDPFNKLNNDGVGLSHRYTIQSLEFGRCGSCSSVEKKFVTGEELSVRGKVVCNQNDWNLIKQYYIQGTKGLLAVYNREVARFKFQNMIRNLALTVALLGVALAAVIYLVSASTLADPLDLFRRHYGVECQRTYYRRPDVIATVWAGFGAAFYYIATVLTFFLVQNFLGFKAWDASIASGPPEAVLKYIITAILPATFYAVAVRGTYMFHYRHVDDLINGTAVVTPLVCSPRRSLSSLGTFLGRNTRTSDMGKVYLIRVYMVIMVSLAIVLISTLHCVYSFIIPFIYRIEHIDAANWTLRFQLISVQLMSFPLWLDSWWSLYRLQDMHVDGISVSQLYEMRSDKEERRVGGFPPGDEESIALNFRGDDEGNIATSAAIFRSSTTREGDGSSGPSRVVAGVGKLQGVSKAGDAGEAARKLAEVELDRTLCMNRIAQLEEELDTIKEAKNDSLNDVKLNNEFLGRGFADLQALLETGFKQLEIFYLETGAVGQHAAGVNAVQSSSIKLPGHGATEFRSAVELTIANLRDESTAARERQMSLIEAMQNLDCLKAGDFHPTEATSSIIERGAGCSARASSIRGASDEEESFFSRHADAIEQKLRQAKLLSDDLARSERQRDELSHQVSHLEREAVVSADEMEKLNDDLAGLQAERDLLERKVNELRRELHAKTKENDGLDAELKVSKSQQVRTMAKLSVQSSKAQKQLAGIRMQMRKLNEDRASLFREVGSLESQLGQARADREESRNWASTYREMLLKVT